MSADLPAALKQAVERELEGVGRAGLAQRARRTSEAYRSGKGSAGVIADGGDALAYALTRAPATYAACVAAFDQAAMRAPGFAPQTILDAGSGTGAASWAAAETWPELTAATFLDSNTTFLDLAGRLATAGPTALSTATRLRGDLTSDAVLPDADLVVASYALAELKPAAMAGAVERLWRATGGVLALVEPGTPAGYQRILAARDRLIALGAEVLAPCAQMGECPLVAPDWCHFSVRLPRSRDHRLAKGAEVPFEDERFSYVIAARPGLADGPAPSRILAPPRAGKPGIEFKLCAPEGLEHRFVARREKAAHAVARRLDWGDPFLSAAHPREGAGPS
jgi:ribosomal protein RSM22 (predicted rRNA methylase)